MRESDVLGASEIGKAATKRRESAPTGMEYLPATFGLGQAAPMSRPLQNPLGIQGGSRAMAGSYIRLLRAATSKRRRDKLSPDEAQDLMVQIIQGSSLTQRPL